MRGLVFGGSCGGGGVDTGVVLGKSQVVVQWAKMQPRIQGAPDRIPSCSNILG